MLAFLLMLFHTERCLWSRVQPTFFSVCFTWYLEYSLIFLGLKSACPDGHVSDANLDNCIPWMNVHQSCHCQCLISNIGSLFSFWHVIGFQYQSLKDAGQPSTVSDYQSQTFLYLELASAHIKADSQTSAFFLQTHLREKMSRQLGGGGGGGGGVRRVCLG